MEQKILFLILALIGIYLLFSNTGQIWLRKYIGVDIQPKGNV